MKINTNALRNLGAFSSHATSNSARDPDTVTRLGKVGGHSSTVKLVTTTADKAYALLPRSSAQKDANNAVRTAFRNAVEELFGGFDNIPESVKNVMKLEDYGKGRPLTTRRILAVQNAIADVLTSADELTDTKGNSCKTHKVMVDFGLQHLRPDSPEAFNNKLKDLLSGGTIEELPDEFRNAVNTMFGEIAARIGSQPPAQNEKFNTHCPDTITLLIPLLDQCVRENRRITPEDIVKTLYSRCEKVMIAKHLQPKIDAIAAKCKMAGINANTFLKNNPDILESLRQSVSKEDFEARVAGFEDRINGMSSYKDDIAKATAPLAARLQAKVEEGVGFPKGALDGQMKLEAFNTKLTFATSRLYDDFKEGKRLNANELEKKFNDLTDEFAQTFIDRCREADECAKEGAISETMAEKWKADIVTYRKPKECTPKKYCEVAAKLGGQELLAALDKKNDTRTALQAIDEFAKKLDQECVKMVGGFNQWFYDLGLEGRVDAVRKIIEAMVDKTPGLGEALEARHKEFLEVYNDILNEKGEQSIGNMFCRIVFDTINFEKKNN